MQLGLTCRKAETVRRVELAIRIQFIWIDDEKIRMANSNVQSYSDEHQKGLLLMIAIEIEIVRIFVTSFTGFLQPSQ